jgi:hypothetical protein
MGAGVSPVALFAHHLCLLQKIGTMYGTVQAEVQQKNCPGRSRRPGLKKRPAK